MKAAEGLGKRFSRALHHSSTSRRKHSRSMWLSSFLYHSSAGPRRQVSRFWRTMAELAGFAMTMARIRFVKEAVF